jgi:hypothetical protein
MSADDPLQTRKNENIGIDGSSDKFYPEIEGSRDRCMDSNIRICVLFLAVVLSGCGVAIGPKFGGLEDAQSDGAILYIYRETKSFGIDVRYPCVFINGEKKDALIDGGYLVYRNLSGPTDIKFDECSWISPGDGGLLRGDIFLVATPSTRHYIKLDLKQATRYQVVSEEVALPEIQQLRRTN